MIKVDLYTSNICSRCIRAKNLVRKVIDELNADKFDLHCIDVIEHIDDAVALGILAAPAIVINNTLVFATLPSEKTLKIKLRSYI